MPLGLYELDAGVFSSDTSLPNIGTDTSMECQELCLRDIVCRAAIYTVQIGMCVMFGGNFSDVPRQIRTSQGNMIFQKLYKTGKTVN